MAKVRITCDSTCDLSKEIIEKYGITVIPLYVTLGENQYRDSVDISLEDLFEYVGKTNQLPKTSAVSVGDYIDVFKKIVSDGDEVVHINICSKMSACHQNACLAAQQISNVYPIDSKNLSTGSGHLVLLAAELAQKGMSGEEIAKVLCQKREKLEVSFVVDTLDYLKMGGRCSSVTALGANLLKLKPCIEVRDGEMNVGKKYRGKMEACLTQYVKERLEGRDDIDGGRIFITHTNASKEIVDQVRAAIEKSGKFDEIIETIAGCTIASHCGKGTLGILFFTK